MSYLQPIIRGAGYNRPHRRRSRNGCLTCKRRKVRCNEQKPQCYHCQRLNLECVWKNAGAPAQAPNAALAEDPAPDVADPGAGWPSPAADFFDFGQPAADLSLFQDIYLPDFSEPTAPRNTLHERELSGGLDTPGSPTAGQPLADVDIEDSLLSHAPPILDPVENGPIRASLRALFDNMAAVSPMVRYSIAAFAAVQYYTTGEKVEYRRYYDKAADELSERFREPGGGVAVSGNELGYVLTTIFFLTYINFLTGRLDLAYSNLAKAHEALQSSRRGALGSLEQRIISWIRWSDARAALAGGEGLLLNDTSGIYPSTPSTVSTTPESQTGPTADSGPHEVIYSMLCEPGIAFFQEVQTTTGRITRIAHHHRSRGSVEDETEVMAIAAEIHRDLSVLYDRRPALTDHAVAGNIPSDTLAEPLASSVVRSFQTYLSNFYACYVHLHRVAHRHLPRSEAVNNALREIRGMARFMVEKDEAVPVNMLWPLFMWGSEEDDFEEGQWILRTIRALRHAATNANMIADVLQEIQRRQGEAGTRVDIRSVCLELFNATFAII